MFSGLAAIGQTNSELKRNDDTLLPGLILNLKCQWDLRLISIDVAASCEKLGCCVLAWLYRGNPDPPAFASYVSDLSITFGVKPGHV